MDSTNLNQIKNSLFHLSRQTGFDIEDAERLEVIAWEIKQDLKKKK